MRKPIPLTGAQYANLVASYVATNFGHRGITLYREVPLGKTIIGKNRRIDVLVIEESTRVALALECKYQDSAGTADEKIPYALQDLLQLGMPVCLVYAGDGFSEGIQHMLAASPIAAQCMPDALTLAPTDATRELDAALAMTFKWWDLVVRGRAPFDPKKR
ncbi:MAG: PD-(D/E)XK nuclease superfamily protein [Sandaracinus sp.]